MLQFGSNCPTRVRYANGIGGTMWIKFRSTLFFSIVSWDTFMHACALETHHLSKPYLRMIRRSEVLAHVFSRRRDPCSGPNRTDPGYTTAPLSPTPQLSLSPQPGPLVSRTEECSETASRGKPEAVCQPGCQYMVIGFSAEKRL